MNESYRFIGLMGTIIVLVSGTLCLFNYVIDPFQYFRQAKLYRPVLWPSLQRQQNAGLARNYAEDVVVVGSSVTENFLAKDIQTSWGRAARRLSISGSTAHEQHLVLTLALETGRVKEVLWGLDTGAFYRQPKAVRDDQAPFPWHMYRTGWAPNIEYLLSLGTMRLSILALKGYGEPDFDKYHTWYDKFEYGSTAVLKDWKGTCADFHKPYDHHVNASPQLMSYLEESLAQNLAVLLHRYPGTTFHLFLPPLATLIYVPAQAGFLQVHIPFREKLAEIVRSFQNARLYDFQSVDWIVDDLRNFKDSMHFSLSITHYIIDAIRDGKNQVQPSEMVEKNRRLIEIVNRYDLCTTGDLPFKS